MKLTTSIPEETDFLLIAPLIHKIVSRKLGSRHRTAVEDIKQKVLLKLWRWKKSYQERAVSGEEWQKLATVVANHELTDFFRDKYTRDVLFSQMSDEVGAEVSAVESSENITGNTETEICSLLVLVWKAARQLTLRQKYAYFLQFPDFIIEFIVCRCCSISELAVYFEVSEKQLSEIIGQLPLSDEDISQLLEKSLGEKLASKQIWEARSKAKAKLAAKLKDTFFNERLFVPKRD